MSETATGFLVAVSITTTEFLVLVAPQVVLELVKK
jgi:hypothetical protein